MLIKINNHCHPKLFIDVILVFAEMSYMCNFNTCLQRITSVNSCPGHIKDVMETTDITLIRLK